MSALDEFDRFDDLRREIAALPDTAPYATWAKWFLSTDPARSIAPGFTVTPAEAEKLEEDLVKQAAASAAATPSPATAAPHDGTKAEAVRRSGKTPNV